MADDGVIRIGTEVDISNIRAGMGDAVGIVKAGTSNMEAAYKDLAKATGEYAVSSANLRAVIRQLADGTTPYKLSVQALTPALKENDAATEALRASKARLLAIQNEGTAAVVANTNAMRMNIEAYGSARVVSGLATGSFNSAGYALARVAATSSILAPLLEAAFPLLAVVAFTGMVIELGKNIYDAFDVGGEKAREFQQNLLSTSNSFQTLIAKTELETDKLDAVNAKLEHRPLPNAAKEAMDEAIVAAQEMDDKLDNLIGKEQSLLKSEIFNPSLTKEMLTGDFGGAHQEQVMLEQHQMWLARAKTIQDQLNESVNYGLSLRIREAELVARTADSNSKEYQDAAAFLREKKQAVPGGSGEESPMVVAGLRKELDATRTLIDFQAKEQAGIQATIDLQKAQSQNATDEAKHQQEVLDKQGESKANKGDEQRVKAAKQRLDEMNAIHQMSAASEAVYWEGLTATAKRGSLLYSTAMDEANKAAARANKPDTSWVDIWDQMQKKQQEAAQEAQKAQEKLDAYNLAVSESATRKKEAQDRANESAALATIRAEEGSGAIRKLGAAEQTAAIHAKAYADELKRIDDEIKKIKADQSLAPAEQQQKLGQLQSQRTQVQGQANVSAIQDQAAIQQQIAQPYLTAFSNINSAWLRVQDQMLYSTRNIGLAFAKMGQGLAIDAINSLEKMALKAVEKDLVMLISHRTMNQLKVASDAQAAAASGTIQQAAGLKEAAIDAKNAAVKGWKAGWNFPFPADLVMAPLLAGVALAGALAQFEDGTGYVPRMGIAMLHPGEAVIPAPTMEELRGSTGGGDITVHHTTNIHGHTERAVIDAIRRNPSEIAGAMKRHLRQGGRI